ncbi:MAG: FAD-dependent oxidoreductase, partial [Terriglobales bacterium]
YTIGRQANSDLLNLEAAGLASDGRGKLKVNEHFSNPVPHIYAAGDVIGFPALASTSMEQGRLASCHMFGTPGKMPTNLIPYGIYTIPEISMVGLTEELARVSVFSQSSRAGGDTPPLRGQMLRVHVPIFPRE